MSETHIPALLKPKAGARLPVTASAEKPTAKEQKKLREEVAPSAPLYKTPASYTSKQRPRPLEASINSITPAEWGALKRGVRSLDDAQVRRFFEVAELMEEECSQYGSLLDARKRSVQAKRRMVEAADDSALAVEIADFWRSKVSAGWFRSFIYDLLDAKGKGISAFKKRLQLVDGKWDVTGMQHLPPTWLQLSDDRQAFRLRDGTEAGEELDSLNYLLHKAGRKSGHMVRGGLALAMGTWVLAQLNGFTWSAEYLERYGVPFGDVEYPDGTPLEDVIGLEMAVSTMARNGYIVRKKGMKVDFATGATATGSDLHKWWMRLTSEEIAKAVAGSTEASEAGGGSNAKAQAQLEVRDDIVDADCIEIAETIQAQLIEPLTKLRWGEGAPVPNFRFDLSTEIPLDQWVAGVKDFVSMGGKVQASEVRDRLQLADPDADAELLVAPQSAQSPAAPQLAARMGAGGAHRPAQSCCPVHAHTAAADPAARAHDDFIDRLAEEMAAEWDTVSAPLQADLTARIVAAGNIDAARAQVAAAFAANEISLGDLQELLARAMAKTAAHGQFEAE